MGLEALRTWLTLGCGDASMTAAPASAQRAALPASGPCARQSLQPVPVASLKAKNSWEDRHVQLQRHLNIIPAGERGHSGLGMRGVLRITWAVISAQLRPTQSYRVRVSRFGLRISSVRSPVGDSHRVESEEMQPKDCDTEGHFSDE